ncbi:hypothetical protein M9458_048710, partial [Cirrhinus mrigala]
MPRRFCRACKAPLHAADNHGECVSCLGLPHVEAALKETEVSPLCARGFFSERDSAPRALPFPPSQEPVKKKQRGRGSQRSELGELTSAQPPRAFSGSEDDLLDSMSLAASDAEELSGSVNDPAPLKSTDTSDPRTKTSTAIGWKTKASHPSKPCRTTSALAGRAYTSAGQAASALHSMAILQVFQAKLFAQSDRSALDPATLKELRSATDLALRATKATAQAIGRSMASLVVLERHLWLTPPP